MIERKLEDVITDFYYVDQCYKDLSEETTEYPKIQKLRNFEKDYLPNQSLLKGSKHKNITTWKECVELCKESIERYNNNSEKVQKNSIGLVRDNPITCKVRDEIKGKAGVKTEEEIEDNATEVFDEIEDDIKLAVLYLGMEYLHREQHPEPAEYGVKYIKDVLGSFVDEEQKLKKEEAEKLQKLLKSLTASRMLLKMDIDRIDDYLDEKYGEEQSQEKEKMREELQKDDILVHGFSSRILRMEVTETAKAIYERTRINRNESTKTEEAMETFRLSRRYRDITKWFLQSVKQIQAQPYLFFGEIVGFVKQAITDDNGKYKIDCMLKTLPVLLLDTQKELPLGAYVQKKEDNSAVSTIGASWTLERMNDVYNKQKVYSNFPLWEDCMLKTETDDSKEREKKIGQILFDFACEDLFHLKRLDQALVGLFDSMKKLDEGLSVEERHRREVQLCILYANVLQYPVPYLTDRILGYFDKLSAQIIEGKELSHKVIVQLFWNKTLFYDSMLSSCVYYLFTREDGCIKSTEEIQKIVEAIAEGITGHEIKEYGFEVLGGENEYIALDKPEKRNKKMKEAKKYLHIKSEYTDMKMPEIFRLMTDQLLFYLYIKMSDYRKMDLQVIRDNNIPLLVQTVFSIKYDTEISKRLAEWFLSWVLNPKDYERMVFSRDQQSKQWLEGVKHSLE